jgi:hypothetical protein
MQAIREAFKSGVLEVSFLLKHRRPAAVKGGSEDTWKMAAIRIKPALKLVFAWLFLNILMNFNYPAQEQNLTSLFLISPEVLFIFGALCTAIWLGMPFHWAIYSPLNAIVIFFRFFRVADELVPMYFFRPFNLYIDSHFLPDLMHLLYNTLPLKTFITYSLLGLLLTVGMIFGIWWSFKAVHQFFAGIEHRRFILVTIIAVFGIQLLFSAAAANRLAPKFHKGFFHRIVEEVDFILHVKGYRTQKLQAINQSTRKLQQTPRSLDKLGHSDVYLIFIESYGHTIFEDSHHLSLLRPILKQYETELAAKGFYVYSSFLRSPALGGSSWLAHGTVASGVALCSQLFYDLLVTSNAETIAHIFNQAGYRTISVMPGTQWPWPEGKFFGYQKHYFAWDFEYGGPKFGWSPMADQYVLQDIYQKEILPRTQPLFIEFVLTSSHAPFHRQPPYLENWDQIGDGSIYHRRKAITFPVVWPDLTNASEAYVTSIIYEIRVLKNFIERFIKDDTLMIIMGDHQPNVQITGPASSWSVPVHVISRNKGFLDPFESRGYTPGLIPRQPPPHPGMETVLFDFLKSFSSPDNQSNSPARPF